MHSYELFALLGGCTLVTGLFGYFHARRYWEGLPPVLDAMFSMAGFLLTICGFVAGGRVGDHMFGHPHAGRLVAVMLALLIYRAARTWVGKEQVRYRAARARKVEVAGE